MTDRKEKGIASFVFFMILYLSCSFVVTNNIISSTMTIALWIVTAIAVFKYNIKIQRTILYTFLILILCMLLTTILKFENIVNHASIVFSYLVVMLYVNRVDFLDFQDIFIKVMFCICVISLIGFFAYIFLPVLYKINPVVTYTTYSNLFIYVDTQHYTRNMGLFWEPGAFQTFVNIALLFEILKKEINIKIIVVFIMTIITTYSTTGYLALILVLGLLIIKKGKNPKIQGAIIAIILALVILIYFNQDFLFSSALSNGQSTVFGKLLNFDIYSGETNSASASVRYNAIFKPIEVFLKSPIWGNGYDNLRVMLYEYTHGMNTCTFINWFAVYGIVFGSIMVFGVVKFIKRVSEKFAILMAVLIIFVATMSENYVHNPVILMIVLYGFKQEKYTGELYENNRNK